MDSDPNCIFCKIVAHQAPAVIIYENADAIAFLDAHPIAQGHTLVTPKKHCRNLFDFPDESAVGVMHAERIVARALRQALNADGLTMFQSNERAGGQSVFHFHAHLIPRYLGDGLIRRPEQLARADAETKPAEIAERIRIHVRDD